VAARVDIAGVFGHDPCLANEGALMPPSNVDTHKKTHKPELVKMPKHKKSKKTKRPKGPESTDRHWLYQESVQSPEEHVEFFDRVYVDKHGRPATSLKEDFCGTAFLSAGWVATRPDNTAVGVDLDLPTLDWGRVNNIAPLSSDEQSRVTLLHDDVMNVTEPKVDILAALNFSYFEFKTRDALRSYFEAARSSINPGGLLVLDMFGGWEAQMEVTDKTRDEGFTYVWEQTKYDPISHFTQFFIHFRFSGGGGIEKAFEYNWRLWTLPEVRELLEEAGFSSVDVYWEQIDEDTNEGSGEFELVTEAENCPGWIALLVAHRD
jgi:SAM-dependent methyltransferase